MASTDRHLVVDGSNIATEGRSLPSLVQLDEAVRAISEEFDYDSMTVVVDATFAHRIDESEREEFEAAVLAGEIVAPPAGAVGRGDAFILQVASKADAVVFSNDSFQEFHGEHDWLFDEGRLVGGKPIEGIGWIFVERIPVRGPTSRRAIRQAGERSTGRKSASRSTTSRSSARRSSTGRSAAKSSSSPSSSSRKRTSASPTGPAPKPDRSNPPPVAKRASRARRSTTEAEASPQPEPDVEVMPASVLSEETTNGDTRKSQVEALNDARVFIGFVSKYSIGDDVEAVVDRFSSHGCYLVAANACCYLPSRAMGDPPPTKARDIVSTGQSIIVKVESIDSDRRGINVTLVNTIDNDNEANPSSSTGENPAEDSQESEEAADHSGREDNPTRSTETVAITKSAKAVTRKSTAKKPAAKRAGVKKPAKATASARVRKATTRKAPAKPASSTGTSTAKSTTTRSTTAKRTTTVKKATTAKKAATRPAVTKKATTAKKAAVKKATTAKKTTATRATTAKKAAVKKATTATKSTARKTTVKKAAATKPATARKTTATRTTAKKATA